MSHQHTLDSLGEKGRSLSQASPAPALSKLQEDCAARYQSVVSASSALVQQFEGNVQQHQQYQDTEQETAHWISAMTDKLAACADTTGDKYALHNKLERLQVSKEN